MSDDPNRPGVGRDEGIALEEKPDEGRRLPLHGHPGASLDQGLAKDPRRELELGPAETGEDPHRSETIGPRAHRLKDLDELRGPIRPDSQVVRLESFHLRFGSQASQRGLRPDNTQS